MSRIVWFIAGSAAGVYTAAKARRAAYRLSAPGVVDQAAALGLGWRELSSEIRAGMLAREQQIVRGLTAGTPPLLRLADASTDSPSIDPTPPDTKAP